MSPPTIEGIPSDATPSPIDLDRFFGSVKINNTRPQRTLPLPNDLRQMLLIRRDIHIYIKWLLLLTN